MFRNYKWRSKKSIYIGVAIVVLFCVSIAWYVSSDKNSQHQLQPSTLPVSTTTTPTPSSTLAPSSDETKTPTPTPSPTPAQTVNSAETISDPSSIQVLVNKKRALPSSYVPAGLTAVGSKQLRSEAADAIKKLVAAADISGIKLTYVSGYRSYSAQNSVYNSYVRSDGQANADTYSARPGHSEHQTGLAIDMGNPDGNCELQICFGDTDSGKWLAAHSHEYGFVIRYPSGKSSITGYQYEPWHLRFVGVEVAKKVYESNQTLEEYYGTGVAPSY